MAPVFAPPAFLSFLLGGIGMAHGLSKQFSLKAELSPALSLAGAPPSESAVMDALANINTSLTAVENIIHTSNSSVRSMGSDVVQAIVDFQKIVETMALGKDAAAQPSLTKEAASQAARLVDIFHGSAEPAETNLSMALDAFSNSVGAILPPADALAKQATSQFLEALTMVEDIYNVTQSEQCLYNRQAAKWAARRAIRDLKAQDAAAIDDENKTSQQVSRLGRFVDRFGFEAAKKMLHRAITKLHGNKAEATSGEDVKDQESPETPNDMVDTSEEVSSEDVANDDTNDATATSGTEEDVMAEEGVKDKVSPDETNQNVITPDDATSQVDVEDSQNVPSTFDSDVASNLSHPQDGSQYSILDPQDGSVTSYISEEELRTSFSPEEIKQLTDRGVIAKSVKTSDALVGKRYYIKETDPAIEGEWVSDADLRKMFTADSIKEMMDRGIIIEESLEHEAKAFETGHTSPVGNLMSRRTHPLASITAAMDGASQQFMSEEELTRNFSPKEIKDMEDRGVIERWFSVTTSDDKASVSETNHRGHIDMGSASGPKRAISRKEEARSLLESRVLADTGVDIPDDLEDALLRKGPLDVNRHDACALATQKIFHANKTLHKLSRKFVGVKTTLHHMVARSVGAGNAAIDSINSAFSPSLAELPRSFGKPVSKGLKTLKHSKIHISQFAQDKAVLLDAVLTLAKATPLAETLQAAVDEACLSGACGETARKACEAHIV